MKDSAASLMIDRLINALSYRGSPLTPLALRRYNRRVMRSYRRLSNRVFYRLDRAYIDERLESLRPDSPTLFVHSSLAHCGYVSQGVDTVLKALSARTNTLCMPTHTYCYPLLESKAPPIYDPCTTQSVVGAISNAFWQRAGVDRSIHPTHSLAATGPDARSLVAGHELCGTPCGIGTPYRRLVERNASVLMFGTSMNTYTLFHTAEDAAYSPYLYEPMPYDLLARDSTGRTRTVRTLRQDMTVSRRFVEMDRVLEQEGLLRRTTLGRGELLFVPSARDVHEYVMSKLRSDPFYLVAVQYRDEVRQRCK